MSDQVMQFSRPLNIRFSHCDPAGIVFYPQYFVLFNGLIEDWITEGIGISYADLIAVRRVGLPTVSLHSDFKAVSRMGDAVVLGLTVQRLGTRSFTLALQCRGAQADDIRVEVNKVIVTTDLDTHRSMDIPEDLRQGIARFTATAAALA